MAPTLRSVDGDDEELDDFVVADGWIVTVAMDKVCPAAVVEVELAAASILISQRPSLYKHHHHSRSAGER